MIGEFSQLFEHVDKAAMLLTLTGEIRAANPVACALFAEQTSLPESIPGPTESIAELGCEELLSILPTLGQQLTAGKRLTLRGRLPFSLKGQQGDQEKSTSICNLSLSLVEAGHESLALLLIDPPSGRLAAELAARQQEFEAKSRELDRFIYLASHDLKSPLVTLLGFAEALKEDYYQHLDTRGREYVEYIISGAARLESLLVALLEFSRIGRIVNSQSLVPFKEILQEAQTVLKSVVDARQAEIITITDLPTITCDRERMVSVMVNLLTNAIKFTLTECRPRIEIGCRKSAESYEFWVRDQGIGINPKFHRKIFELFYRIKELNVEGNGVGLALVRKIIEAHGGQVRVESAPAAGSCFYFALPVGAPELAGIRKQR